MIGHHVGVTKSWVTGRIDLRYSGLQGVLVPVSDEVCPRSHIAVLFLLAKRGDMTNPRSFLDVKDHGAKTTLSLEQATSGMEYLYLVVEKSIERQDYEVHCTRLVRA